MTKTLGDISTIREATMTARHSQDEDENEDIERRRERAARFADRYIAEHRELFEKLEDE
jgi:hypothetical protein